jgi:hypothetical protein
VVVQKERLVIVTTMRLSSAPSSLPCLCRPLLCQLCLLGQQQQRQHQPGEKKRGRSWISLFSAVGRVRLSVVGSFEKICSARVRSLISPFA